MNPPKPNREENSAAKNKLDEVSNKKLTQIKTTHIYMTEKLFCCVQEISK